MALQFKTVVVTPFSQNCRILYNQKGGSSVVIDPGGDVDLINSELKSLEVTCSQIWLTHSHLDHCGGVSKLLKATGAELLAHRDEQMFRQRVEEISAMYGISEAGLENCPEPDRYIAEGEILNVADVSFSVIHVPGHSPGHLCFYSESESLLVGGDTIFQGSIGRTDLPGGNHSLLIESIWKKLLVLPPKTKVLVGHGVDTSIGVEIKSNEFFRNLRV